MGRTLRVALLGVRVQEARRYHVSIQVLAAGQAPAGVVVLNDPGSDKYAPDQIARTETSDLTTHPEFLNRVFVLRLAEPLTAFSPIFLHCNLFAMPSLDSTNPGVMVAGKEVDELMGCAQMQLAGEHTARLLQGDRINLPVPLNNGRGGDMMDTNTDLMASMYGVRAGKELLLEVQLLDAHVTLPRDLYSTMNGTGSAKLGKGPKSRQSRLMVFVSHADNLPTTRGANGSEQAPKTFVAAKSSADVRNSVAAQALTRTSSPSTSPVWGQLLQLTYPEDQLSSEELHLGIVNDLDSRHMLKTVLPLGQIQAGIHYNLRLQIPGGPLNSLVSLYVTLCLVGCPSRQARHVKALSTSGVSHVISARLAKTSAPPHTLVPAAQQPLPAGSQIVAAWVSPDQSDGSSIKPIDTGVLFEPVMTADVPSVVKQLQQISDRQNQRAMHRAGQVQAALPIHVAGCGGDDYWPADHMVQVPHQASDARGLELQLHLIQPASTTTIPLASASIPAAQISSLTGNPSLLDALLLQAVEGSGGTCSVEMGCWSCDAYHEHLNKSVPGEADELDGAGAEAGLMTWQGKATGDAAGSAGPVGTVLETLVNDLLMKQIALERVARQVDASESRSETMGMRLADAEHRVRVLNQDLNKLRQLLHEEKEASRVPSFLENSLHLSRDDLVEKAESALAAFGRERRRNAELVHRLQQMHGEQVDMLEMKKRYQELQVAHMEMTKSMSEVQGPVHSKMSTYRATMKMQEEVIRNLEALLAQTVDKVRNMPALNKANQQLKQQVQKLASQVSPTQAAAALKSMHDADARKLESVNDQMSHLMNANNETVKENVKLKLELKQAHDKTKAARDELVSAIKRYASEIADLKWRIAEKDAHLMGGFGSPARLKDHDDDLGIPRVNPAMFNTAPRVTEHSPRVTNASRVASAEPQGSPHQRPPAGPLTRTISAGNSPTVAAAAGGQVPGSPGALQQQSSLKGGRGSSNRGSLVDRLSAQAGEQQGSNNKPGAQAPPSPEEPATRTRPFTSQMWPQPGQTSGSPRPSAGSLAQQTSSKTRVSPLQGKTSLESPGQQPIILGQASPGQAKT